MGLVVARLANAHGTAQIALHGGHVLDYTPTGQRPVVWLSERSLFQAGKAIRGGIPVCWPWFGPHPSDTSKPAHGFARTSVWDVRSTIGEDDATTLVLGLLPDDATRALWPHAFDLELSVVLGNQLYVALTMTNTDSEAYQCSSALHSYFAIGDITQISVGGLDGVDYVDKVADSQRKTQRGPVQFGGETDRVYLGTTANCVIDDPVLGRRIHVGRTGSTSVVLWNPWADKAAALTDMGPGSYRTMVCVEAANALDDTITLEPGASHQLTTSIRVE